MKNKNDQISNLNIIRFYHIYVLFDFDMYMNLYMSFFGFLFSTIFLCTIFSTEYLSTVQIAILLLSTEYFSTVLYFYSVFSTYFFCSVFFYSANYYTVFILQCFSQCFHYSANCNTAQVQHNTAANIPNIELQEAFC